jgi:hypothetical protein
MPTTSKLTGKDKERALQRALELFPDAHALLARQRDHGPTEAALIALFGLRAPRLTTAPSGAQPGLIPETSVSERQHDKQRCD